MWRCWRCSKHALHCEGLLKSSSPQDPQGPFAREKGIQGPVQQMSLKKKAPPLEGPPGLVRFEALDEGWGWRGQACTGVGTGRCEGALSSTGCARPGERRTPSKPECTEIICCLIFSL